MNGLEYFEVKWVLLMWLMLKDAMLSQRRKCPSVFMCSFEWLYVSGLHLCFQGTNRTTFKPAREERQPPRVLGVVRPEGFSWRSVYPALRLFALWPSSSHTLVLPASGLCISDPWLWPWLWFLSVSFACPLDSSSFFLPLPCGSILHHACPFLSEESTLFQTFWRPSCSVKPSGCSLKSCRLLVEISVVVLHFWAAQNALC